MEDEDNNPYSMENILEYFEYLQKLKNLEDNFRNAGVRLQDKPAAETKPLSRKRRSIGGEGKERY